MLTLEPEQLEHILGKLDLRSRWQVAEAQSLARVVGSHEELGEPTHDEPSAPSEWLRVGVPQVRRAAQQCGNRHVRLQAGQGAPTQ